MIQTVQRKRFGTPKIQEEVVVDNQENLEEDLTEEQEDKIINAVSQSSDGKRIRTPKKEIIQEEEVIMEEKEEVKATSVVQPYNKSTPPKFNYFQKRKVEKVIKEVEETNTITGKDSNEVLASLYVEYLSTLEDETEDGTLIKDIIKPETCLLFLETFQEFFTTNIFPKYDKVKFLGSVFNKHKANPNFRKSAPTKIDKDGQTSYIYSEGDVKTTFQLELESSPNRAYIYVDDDNEVDYIERVDEKKQTTEVTDGSLDHLIPELKKYIESKIIKTQQGE